MRHTRFALASVLSLWMGATAAFAQPLGTSFTYQGELRSAGEPAAGVHDLRFRLFDAASKRRGGAAAIASTASPARERGLATGRGSAGGEGA